MPETTKIALSDHELSLACNADWILTKHTIIEKVFALFALMPAHIKKSVLESQNLPEEVKASVPRIFRGENYRGLPYVTLDYPRCFDKEDIFALRTMFWWGRFFSITLQVSGKHKSMLRAFLQQEINDAQAGLYIGVNEDPWQHHFEQDNYLPIDQLSITQRLGLLENNKHVKLAYKYDLKDWNSMTQILSAGYIKLAKTIN